jgi:hypothetical protein
MSATRNVGPVLAATQMSGKALLADRYDMRSARGRLLFTVSRAEAERWLAEGLADPVGRNVVKYLQRRMCDEVGRLTAEDSITTTRERNRYDHRWQNDKGRFIRHPYQR